MKLSLLGEHAKEYANRYCVDDPSSFAPHSDIKKKHYWFEYLSSVHKMLRVLLLLLLLLLLRYVPPPPFAHNTYVFVLDLGVVCNNQN